jgi:Transglycosylase SLT domain
VYSAVRRLARRGAPWVAVGILVAVGGAAVAGGAVMLETSSHPPKPPNAASTPLPATASPSGLPHGRPEVITAVQVAPLRRIIPPDVLVVVPKGISSRQLAAIKKLKDVREMISVDGGAIQLRAHLTNVLGVDPSSFRSWTPPATAAQESIWSALAKNQFVLSNSAQNQLGLQLGSAYQLVGATQPVDTLGASASLGVPGVDALVSHQTADALGLVHNVAAMINAPGANVGALMKQVRSIVGGQSQILNLDASSNQLPIDNSGQSPGRPGTYLQLYKQSAAQYCPGLSWTILAAIGQVESGHGRNVGPSSAGALGPMQFEPSTWEKWGIPGFGDTTANIMDPYDAVPSAARYLCASGAPRNVSAAVFAYNHAGWYVSEVLALAQQYAQQFG